MYTVCMTDFFRLHWPLCSAEDQVILYWRHEFPWNTFNKDMAVKCNKNSKAPKKIITYGIYMWGLPSVRFSCWQHLRKWFTLLNSMAQVCMLHVTDQIGWAALQETSHPTLESSWIPGEDEVKEINWKYFSVTKPYNLMMNSSWNKSSQTAESQPWKHFFFPFMISWII